MPLVLSGATTPGQSGPGSNGNEGGAPYSRKPRITGTSPSDCLVSYPRHSFGGGLTPLQRCSQCILQPQLTGQGLFLAKPCHDRFIRNVLSLSNYL